MHGLIDYQKLYKAGVRAIKHGHADSYYIGYKPANNRKGEPVYCYECSMFYTDGQITMGPWQFVAEPIPSMVNTIRLLDRPRKV